MIERLRPHEMAPGPYTGSSVGVVCIILVLARPTFIRPPLVPEGGNLLLINTYLLVPLHGYLRCFFYPISVQAALPVSHFPEFPRKSQSPDQRHMQWRRKARMVTCCNYLSLDPTLLSPSQPSWPPIASNLTLISLAASSIP
jgi:hypothetical protein